jgi:hypothetical protein
VRAHAHRSFSQGVYERNGDLAVLHKAQIAFAEPATGGNRDSVRETAVGFDDGEDAFEVCRQSQPEELGRAESHAHAEHLTWAQLLVERGQPRKVQTEVVSRGRHMRSLASGCGARLPEKDRPCARTSPG